MVAWILVAILVMVSVLATSPDNHSCWRFRPETITRTLQFPAKISQLHICLNVYASYNSNCVNVCVCVWVVISCLLVQFNSQLWDKHWPTTKEFNKDQHCNGERRGKIENNKKVKPEKWTTTMSMIWLAIVGNPLRLNGQ